MRRDGPGLSLGVTTVTRASVGLRSERGPVLGAVMLSTALIALDSTIIATAVPAVVDDLGGFSQFPWLFSVYLLTQAVTVPVYGKLADVYGRKPVLLFGIAVFVAASLFCGLAWSMPALIVGRALQGIGAGAVQAIGMTVIGDIYTVEERAKVQGYLASVWGVSSVLGPTLGGVFSDYLSWRWIFLVNLPLGAVALVVLYRRFSERVERREHRLDVAGAVLLSVGCSLLILGLLEGGSAWAWTSGVSVAVLVTAVALLAAFTVVERRAAEPVLPLWVLRRRILLTGNVAALALGALLIGLSSYLPTWAQGVLGASALEAGFALAALTLGWPIAASQAGRLYLRIGFRNTALIGVVLAVLGTTGTALLGLHAQLWQVAASMFVTGIGLGLSSSPLIVAVQSVVGWNRRGVVTATNMFARSIGSAVGAAVFGAIANTTLAGRFASPPAGLEGDVPTDVDGTTAALSRGGAVAEYARESLHAASHGVFIATAVTAVVIAVAVAAMPRRTERLRFDDEHSTDEAATPGPGPAAETAGRAPEPDSADGHRPPPS
ncbi:putative multidrug resistance protein MdtD [Geodermatophilus obscurus DSM 43160]|uniref:Major facilitator superfamily MFS_1 n=1 Tax=Geodermatophilus obscurus (strain ATCC 25078 / DSM 43160 / JCM 3152 / CCUG 61914 / KCC A-0152 / KCTC 9177 / NBRC 13315 / NRRL B-3577 / G-20) TaxID=526225 RepID=D2S5D9_GEOOG|nr:major facilitator superfamily MFS_1 [Geodermatophilus obscurus DSM 43160]